MIKSGYDDFPKPIFGIFFASNFVPGKIQFPENRFNLFRIRTIDLNSIDLRKKSLIPGQSNMKRYAKMILRLNSKDM